MEKISDVIATLTKIMNEYGNLGVMACDENGRQRFDLAFMQAMSVKGDVLIITSGPQM